MSLRLADPLPLLALVAVVAVAAGVHLAFGRPTSARRRLWGTLHWSAVALVALALAQPQLRTSARPPTVLVIDRSASIDATMQSAEANWVAAVARADCPRPCRVVRFAGTAQPVAATRAAIGGTGPGPDATSVGAALQTALGLVPAHGRIVVLSDGWATPGAATASPSGAAGAASLTTTAATPADEDPATTAALAQARARHVTVDTVRLTDPRLRYAAVTEVRAPAVVHVGDAVPVQLTVRSSVTEPATLYLIGDGQSLGTQTIDLHAGDNPLLLSYTAATPGWHSYQARVVLFSNDMPQNDEAGAVVDVVGAPRVLDVEGDAAAPVAGELSGLGFSVTTVSPGALPAAPDALAGEDAVVLDDVPASALSAAQMSALSSAVRQGGLGLVALGGPQSFSLGRYAHTALDAVLPVASLVPGNLQRRNVAIELVLDHSGSMIDLAGGVPKIEMVHVAGAQVTRFVDAHHDELGIVDFDIAPHVLVPMQPIASAGVERAVLARVQGLQADGGTNIYAALQAGFTQLERSSAPDKHLILMTDGISQPENYTPLLSTLDRDHIAVATVALGIDADKSLLYDIAKATDGNYYYTNDAHQLPLIFGKETRFDVKPVKTVGHVTVSPGSDSPAIRSLAGRALPPLTGNVITTLRTGAQADLLAAGPSTQVQPAMAQWQTGAGRVVAITAGLGPPWANAYARQTALLNDTVRWVQRAANAAPLTPTVVDGVPAALDLDLAADPSLASLHAPAIAGRLTSSTGQATPVVLRPSAPALYTAPLPPLPEGIYSFTLAPQGGGAAAATGLVAIPYLMEFDPQLPSAGPLGSAAVLTGGRALAAGDPAVIDRGGYRAVWWVPALLGLALFLTGALDRLLESPRRDGDGDGDADGGGHRDLRGNGYSLTSPADRAASASTSSAGTSVGAST